MQPAFADNWQEAGGGLLPAEAVEPPPRATAGAGLTQLLIGSAQKRLWISNAYFVPDEGILQLPEDRRRAGVDVRLLVAGPVHDWKPILAAQRAAYERLLDAGVRIDKWQPSMMHANDLRHAKEIQRQDVPGLSAYQSLSREVTRIIGRW